MPPFAFTEEQFDRVMHAASLLPANMKDNFVRSVANRVADRPFEVTLGDVETAIRFVLTTRGIAVGRAAFSNKTDKVAVRSRADRHFHRGVSR
jgi:hypothetical protein